MKKYILPFMSIAMLMGMASCSSSDDEVAEIKEENKLVPMTFTATQESNAGTRAELGTGNSVVWQTTDAISIFDGEGNQQFTLTGDVTEGKFSGEASSDATKFTAVYPYTSGATLGEDGSVSGITLPAEQTAIAGSFDPNAALMMAYTEDKSKLEFKNAVSLVKIQTEFACKQIVLSANEDIAGTGTLSYNNGEPSITFDSNKSQTVTLNPAAGNASIAAGTYYIAICPHTSTGFSIRFINSDDSKAYTRTSTQDNTFNRSEIKNLGTFTESGTWTSTIESNGSVKASQEVDMGVFNINGTDYRLIFTNANLTATGLAQNESDYGDYFAWGAKEPWCTAYTRESATKVTPTEWKTGKESGYVSDNNPNLSKEYVANEVLSTSDDPARQILGGDWQLPTKEIWAELYNKTKDNWEWTTKDGYNGRKVTSITDNTKSIFLPAAGRVLGSSFSDVGSRGYYWSGTASSSTRAYYLYFSSGAVNAQDGSNRYCGLSVRPVRLVAE